MILEQLSDKSRAQLALSIVAYALGYDLVDVAGESRRTRRRCTVRQLAMYLTYTAFGMSLSRCAYAFGRDRSTVAYACSSIENRRDDAAFDDWIVGLEKGLRSLAPFAPDGAGAI